MISTDTSSSLRLSIAEAIRKEIHRPWQKTCSQQKSFLSVPLETGITLPGQKRDCTPQGKLCVVNLVTKNYQFGIQYTYSGCINRLYSLI